MLLEKKFYGRFAIYCIISYVVLLSAEGLVTESVYENVDIAFNVFFAIECLANFIAYGIKSYIRLLIKKIIFYLI